MKEIIKETIDYYKARKREEKEKQRLINSKTNFNMLEQLVQKVNENPNLKIRVLIADGTILELSAYNRKTQTISGLINGVETIQ